MLKSLFCFIVVYSLMVSPIFAIPANELERGFNLTQAEDATALMGGKTETLSAPHRIQLAQSHLTVDDLEKAQDEEKALDTENETLRKRINELEKEVQALQSKRENLNNKLNQ